VVYGEKQTHLTQNQAALDVQVVSRRPFFKAPKAFPVMLSLGRRANSVQLRVGDPLRNRASRSSRFHKPASPRAALGIATIFGLQALMSDAAVF